MEQRMTADAFVARFRAARASAILRTDRAEAAGPAMAAAVRGGFRVIEFTLTTPGAFDLIHDFAGRSVDGERLAVGAGTVLTADDAKRAIDAGAVFLVSPVVDEVVIGVAVDADVAMMAGTHTPTEMLRAYRAGSRLQKLFPAPGMGGSGGTGGRGGPDYVRACLGPMPFLQIVPTSGVDVMNAASYLEAGAFAVGFVGPLFEAEALASGDWDRVEERARALLAAVAGGGSTQRHGVGDPPWRGHRGGSRE